MQVILSEFLADQKERLKSLTENTKFWQSEQIWYTQRGQFDKAKCIQEQMPALKSATSLSMFYYQKLEEVESVEKISTQLFEDLSQMGRLATTMTELHEAMGNCMIEVDLRESRSASQRTIYRLGEIRSLRRMEFMSLNALEPTKSPLR